MPYKICEMPSQAGDVREGFVISRYIMLSSEVDLITY